MRITLAITGAWGNTGGIATLNLNILHALIQLTAKHRVTLRVLSLSESAADRPPFLPAEVGFRGFGGNKRLFGTALLRAAARRSLLFFDHVTLALPVLPLAALGWVQTVIFAHGSESWRRIRRTSRWSFRCAQLTLTNSHYTLGRMRHCLTSLNGVACPLGLSPLIPLNATIAPPPAEPFELTAANGQLVTIGNRMLLLVGRMHPGEREKGHDELLDVWPTVRREFPDAQLVFAGPGDDRPRLIEKAVAGGGGDAVFFPGRISERQLQELYHRSYAYVMPSRQEGFGLVYLEAMNYGKPCVGCRDDGAEEIIEHERTGLLLRQPVTREEIFACLGALLRDPQRAQEMGEQGFRRLHEQFTARQLQERICRHISTLLPC